MWNVEEKTSKKNPKHQIFINRVGILERGEGYQVVLLPWSRIPKAQTNLMENMQKTTCK